MMPAVVEKGRTRTGRARWSVRRKTDAAKRFWITRRPPLRV